MRTRTEMGGATAIPEIGDPLAASLQSLNACFHPSWFHPKSSCKTATRTFAFQSSYTYTRPHTNPYCPLNTAPRTTTLVPRLPHIPNAARHPCSLLGFLLSLLVVCSWLITLATA